MLTAWILVATASRPSSSGITSVLNGIVTFIPLAPDASGRANSSWNSPSGTLTCVYSASITECAKAAFIIAGESEGETSLAEEAVPVCHLLTPTILLSVR